MILQQLLGVDMKRNFAFFSNGLREELDGRTYSATECDYVASILAHYALLPWVNSASSVVGTELGEYLETALFVGGEPSDPGILETKGSHILLLVGFFRSQMQRRYNVRFYDEIGQSYYHRVYKYSRDTKRKEFFERFAETFPFWTHSCGRLHNTLRDNRYVLRVD